MARYVVATIGEIPPGGRKILEVTGRSIGVFNVGGEFYALRNRCPHQGGPLCDGLLIGLILASRPGEYRYLREGEILRCPWHGWEFDVKTGQSLAGIERRGHAVVRARLSECCRASTRLLHSQRPVFDGNRGHA